MSEHSPLPWRKHDVERSTLVDRDGYSVALVSAIWSTAERNEANLDLIRASVNEREELLAALEPFAGIADYVEDMRPDIAVWVHANNVRGNFSVTVADCLRARSVLSKAKGQQ